MALVKIKYCCPVCNRKYDTHNGAIKCRNEHPVLEEKWAVGSGGKAVRIFDNCSLDGRGGLNWALKEAELSDFKEERKEQLEQIK